MHDAHRPPTRRPKPSARSEQPSAFAKLRFPTGQNLLDLEREKIFMPTAAGKIESAFFGSARTGNNGLPRFHAGIDIAPLRRDRRGHPLDTVHAIADGRIAHINRHGGNSSYGVYIVILHDDPVGKVYSLYAHLASVAASLRENHRVEAGALLGIMGHSATTGIPLARAHLHLEIGTMLNDHFGAWSRKNEILPYRGNAHGWNLFSVDSLDVYASHARSPNFSLLDYLEQLQPAFELLLHAPNPPNYFLRYPALWHGHKAYSGPMVLRVSEGGVILHGRPANEQEANTLARSRQPVVLSVNNAVLQRNGLRLIEQRNGKWLPGRAAQRWIEILLY